MTNAEIIRKEYNSDRTLAEHLIIYNSDLYCFYCSDGTEFKQYEYSAALDYEITWLRSEAT